MVDGVNAILIASRSTDAPMRFVNFKQQNEQPPMPTALVADITESNIYGASYYRDESMCLRTPTKDSEHYTDSASGKLLEADHKRWRKIKLAQPLFKDFSLRYGFESYTRSKPSDSKRLQDPPCFILTIPNHSHLIIVSLALVFS